MASPLRRAAAFVAIFLCSAGFDQGTKAWALTLPAGQRQPVIDGVWDWELAHNPGVAFSSLQRIPHGALLLSLLAVAMLVGIVVVAVRTRPEQRLMRIGLALIAGGALGNLVDRLRHGAVTDFIRWRAGDHMWPIFNVADALLLIGVALVFFSPKPSPAPKLAA
jgi:signal peptidase II